MNATQVRLSTDAVSALPDTLLKAYSEVCAIIENLRESRDVLHRTMGSRLQHTTAKLEEVSNATELAATGILDGLDRSIALVDKLDELDGTSSPDALAARTSLRDELYTAQAALQFQDITSQQLKHAGSMLADMEARLVEVARSLDVASATGDEKIAAVAQPVDDGSFDPGATMRNADTRQALADAIFQS
ncbi:MAG TPA: hypothetical protein VE967_11405 [Gemmatimonadaceae bacterium]|nr:hypothetical protein [Gemmatimonadaceae bacterium]